jgi:hypothetical protein
VSSTAIHETTNYDRFELLPFNRDVRKVGPLRKSMQKYGWLDAYPLFCLPTHGAKQLLRIKDGHHRFQVARELGLAIKYVQADSEVTVSELAASTQPWNLLDFVVSGARDGDSDLIQLRDMQRELNLPISMTASLMAGYAVDSAKTSRAIRDGYYRVTQEGIKHLRRVADLASFCATHGAGFTRRIGFLRAISRVLFVEEFSPEELKAKILTHPSMLYECRSMDDYTRMLEELYNHQRKAGRLPLFFLAGEAMRQREPDHVEKGRKKKTYAR